MNNNNQKIKIDWSGDLTATQKRDYYLVIIKMNPLTQEYLNKFFEITLRKMSFGELWQL